MPPTHTTAHMHDSCFLLLVVRLWNTNPTIVFVCLCVLVVVFCFVYFCVVHNGNSSRLAVDMSLSFGVRHTPLWLYCTTSSQLHANLCHARTLISRKRRHTQIAYFVCVLFSLSTVFILIYIRANLIGFNFVISTI